MKTRSRLFALLLPLVLHTVASADGLSSLEAFIKTAQSGRADFAQVVTSPARDNQTARSKTSFGSFEFVRPNRFRFNYKKPFAQLIVADGQTLWMYDADLNQVTSRKQAQVLGSTPAALIAAAPDLRSLQTDFSLQSEPDKDGLQWALATPKAKEGQLASIRIGLKGLELAVLDIQDSFGQRSVLTFSNVQTNPAMAPDAFAFKPPAGADLLRQ
ncbi:MAG: outer rane lipoprotein chaperone LolA [Pseudomonadota bacterium]|jgi:outer membrane lipoprotein carrier protein